MHAILTQRSDKGDAPQTAAFDLSQPEQLERVAAIMQIDAQDILFSMEEHGRVDTDTCSLEPPEDSEDEDDEAWADPARLSQAQNWLDEHIEDMPDDVYETLGTALALVQSEVDHAENNAASFAGELKDHIANAEKDAYARAVEKAGYGPWLVGWNKAGCLPENEPVQIEGPISAAWELAAEECDRGTEEHDEGDIDFIQSRNHAAHVMRTCMVRDGAVLTEDGFEFWVKRGE